MSRKTGKATVSYLPLFLVLAVALFSKPSAAEPDKFVQDGRLMLQAISTGDVGKARILLNKGYIDPNGFTEVDGSRIKFLNEAVQRNSKAFPVFQLLLDAGAREISQCNDKYKANGTGRFFFQGGFDNDFRFLISLLKTGDFATVASPLCSKQASYLGALLWPTFNPPADQLAEVVQLVKKYPLERNAPTVGSFGNTAWMDALTSITFVSSPDATRRVLEFLAAISPNRKIDIDEMYYKNSMGYSAAVLWRRTAYLPTGGPSKFMHCRLAADIGVREGILHDFFGTKWSIFKDIDSVSPLEIIYRCRETVYNLNNRQRVVRKSS